MKKKLAASLLSLLARTSLLFLPSAVTLNLADDALGHVLPFAPQHVRSDTIKTEKQYLAVLRASDAITFKNEFETEFLLLLDAQQMQAYDSLPTLDARKAYIENYWKASNPNPLLPENDWLVDVLKRRAYARENFPYWKPPYFDDRGKYYLKYGKPSFRYEDIGNFKTRPNESWSYENVTHNLLVHFMKDGAIFREIENLADVLLSGKPLNPDAQVFIWMVFAEQRAAVSPVFGQAAARLQMLETEQAHAAFAVNSLTVLTEEFVKPAVPTLRIFEQAKVEVLKAHDESPVAAHNEIQAINKLKFSHDLAQFRGPKGATRLEIALLSPFNKNLLKKFSRDSGDTLRLGYR
ncbi:MAG: GWxTD domain-containing protein, partial [bacterium]